MIKNIPEAVNRRLSALSSNQELFDSVKAPYQEALNNAGYDYVLEYHPVENCTKKKTRRRRKITWWFSQQQDASPCPTTPTTPALSPDIIAPTPHTSPVEMKKTTFILKM